MSKNSKRPRLQTTVEGDIAPRRHFTHSSHTATRTRQIVTTVKLEPTKTATPLIEMDPECLTPISFDECPVTAELDLPAGVEVLRKAQRYVNSVWMII